MEYDLHSKIKSLVAVNFGTIAANTTTQGNVIDTLGYESMDFSLVSGTITDGSYTLLLEHGDQANLSDAAVVPAANLQGALGAFDSSNDNVAVRTGYSGKKRYVRASIVSTGVTTGGTLGVLAVLGNPKSIPTPDALEVAPF